MEEKYTQMDEAVLKAVEKYKKTIYTHRFWQWVNLGFIAFFAVMCAVVYL